VSGVAESTERNVEKTKHDLAYLVEEAAANMCQLMAAAPGSGTAEAQDAQQAASRLFESVMATNKRFAEALLDRAAPSPAMELQRRFVSEYFDTLARGGTQLLRAVGEVAQQPSQRQTREHGHQEDVGEAVLTARSEPAPTDRTRRPRSQASRRNRIPVRGKAAE